jgi:Tfp pilus assembly protein PilF
MNCIVRRLLPAFLLWTAVLTIGVPSQAQEINVPASVSLRPAISVLDSTKEQDGLLGSVRRVKIETAKIELKDGRAIEGPAQLVEITTYGIKGNRIENTSYPLGGGVVGKEEYKYDQRGNITDMTMRNDRGSIVNREAYSYEFDKFGNWTKMVTSLVVFENGELKREPIEVTYRTVTYYFDDTVAKIIEQPKTTEAAKPQTARAVPEAADSDVRDQAVGSSVKFSAPSASVAIENEPPPLFTPVKSVPSVAEKPATDNTDHTDLKKAVDLYTTGRDRFDSGDAAGAVELYLQSLKLEPRSSEAQLSLGHAYLKLEKDRDAIKAFKEAIKLNPNVAESHYGLGYCNFRLARFREAADAFKKATTLDPKMAKAHYGLSLAYQELGNDRGLLEEYRTLERLDKSLAKKLAQTFPQFDFSCRLMRGCP